MTNEVDKILEERGKRYGEFRDNAYIAQSLKDVLRTNSGWLCLVPSQREALDMLMSKVSRILAGDAKYVDNWDDIAGYASLISKELK